MADIKKDPRAERLELAKKYAKKDANIGQFRVIDDLEREFGQEMESYPGVPEVGDSGKYRGKNVDELSPREYQEYSWHMHNVISSEEVKEEDLVRFFELKPIWLWARLLSASKHAKREDIRQLCSEGLRNLERTWEGPYERYVGKPYPAD